MKDELPALPGNVPLKVSKRPNTVSVSSQIPAADSQAKAPVSTSALWTQYFPVDKKEEAPAAGRIQGDT